MRARTETLLCIGMLALTLTGCGRESAAPTEEIRPVRVQRVSPAANATEATYSGEVRARHESRYGFKVAGKVVERLVEVGERVAPGQALMRLDPQDAVLSAESAAAQSEAARIKLLQSDVDLRRYEQLQRDGFISNAALEQYRVAQETAASQLRSAEAQHRISVNQRQYTVLRADRPGVVTAFEVDAGQVVSAGQVVLTLADDGEREVLVSVPESRIDELREAGRITVSTWVNPQRHYAATLRELAPDADKATRTYAARVALAEADDTVRLGMTASVRVADRGDRTSIRIPLAAIHQRADKTLVWVVAPETSTVTARPVSISNPSRDSVQVVEGLKAGEVIVTAGVHLLQAGQKVRPISPATLVGSAS